MTNPLRLIHDTLWELLEGCSLFTALVPVGNRIKLNATGITPFKQNASPADYPQVTIRFFTVETFSESDSSGGTLTMGFAIETATGEQGDFLLLDIQWAVLVAMSHWEEKLEALLWNGKKIVTDCSLRDANNTLDNAEANRMTRGWSSVWSGEAELWFATNDLKAQYTST